MHWANNSQQILVAQNLREHKFANSHYNGSSQIMFHTNFVQNAYHEVRTTGHSYECIHEKGKAWADKFKTYVPDLANYSRLNDLLVHYAIFTNRPDAWRSKAVVIYNL